MKHNYADIKEEVIKLGEIVLDETVAQMKEAETIAEYNEIKVLKAFNTCNVSERHFMETTGYGYNDDGRDTLELLFSTIFGTQDALVRPSLVSGTNALYIALSALTVPYDEILSPVGKPYDTLEKVIGSVETACSLKENLVRYRQVDFKGDEIDFEKIKSSISDKTKLVIIQRSKGYDERPSLSVQQMGELMAFIKGIKSDIICLVDNCYGEFVDIVEPSEVGADVIVGSLIKNAGGFLAHGGGYIAGRKDLIERCANRLTAPGLGKEVGANHGLLRDMYRGLYIAPTVVLAAVKTAIFASGMFTKLGFTVNPPVRNNSDIITSIRLGSREGIVSFCESIQAASPIDSFVTPEPYAMPGYSDEVIMAAGTFIQGSSIELSADAPIREPYDVYLQGSITFTGGKYAIMKTISDMIEKDIIDRKKVRKILEEA